MSAIIVFALNPERDEIKSQNHEKNICGLLDKTLFEVKIAG